ncbi:orphan sodium- and chloride-dependent neurotransmitter transporter NTT5-like isoform X1 [Felis catus]|uniref:orphan sodium- and chloride-dependent neurotransmitter transporter NTT5-like isoform X1 n=2 Tax=Felis catus TaxID=9685 RepID=UPI001D199267|nr:orphan sodium- and chloride-dependent neurotransmitter transporter NTT5-like isoform X1 [Felis catus]XP_044903155.1 orphan sodium- and chloride-dependent neurotransmitter transporter NTT5-like isoform X1 [Felis catus]
MESLEEISEEEAPKGPRTSSFLSGKLTAKEILATKTQNYFAETKRTEDILMQVAFSIGLGSIWRFPYLCQRNGGGSFILMYFLMLLSFGIPLLYMEMIMGHWLRVDNIRVWKQLVPWLGGIGYASILVCILMSLYNSVIITWSLSYLANSFDNSLPWNHCPLVKTTNVTDLSCLRTVSHQYFWYHTTLSASGHIEEGVDALVLHLTLGIFAAWFLLFLTMITGLKISMQLSSWASLDLWRQAGGHVVYSLGLGPGTTINFSSKAGGNSYIQVASLVALVNLVTSLLLTSIIFIVLEFWATTSGHTCVEKSVSKLISLIKKGVLPQDAKPPEDILLLPALDYLDWISNLPQHLQYPVIHFSPSCSIVTQKDKFMEGPGLAFAAFSQAISLFPGASLWAILFFLALVIMGLSTLMSILEGIVCPLQTSFSLFRRYPKLLSVLVCLGGFLGSLVFTSHAGSYIMSLFDDCLVPLTLIVIVAFQNVALAWIYGARRFREEMFSKLDRLLWSFFTFLWRYVTLPGLLALFTICLMQLHRRVPSYYTAWNSSMSQEVKQPYLQSALSWVTFLSILTFLPIPVQPLHHWWHLEDHVAFDPFETLQSKKMPLVPPKSLQYPKHQLVTSQKTDTECSSRKVNPPLIRRLNLSSLWRFSLPLSEYSQSSSWFSLPVISSLTSALSMRNASTPVSRQVSLASETIGNSDKSRETQEEN